LRLGKTYGNDRLEAAARIALEFDLLRVQQISDLLKSGRDKQLVQGPTLSVANRSNIRGAAYYNGEQTNLTLL
jgi:hypothetical protein